MFERIKWYIKQLLPMTYVASFTEEGQRRIAIWRMWLGRCFDERYYDIDTGPKELTELEQRYTYKEYLETFLPDTENNEPVDPRELGKLLAEETLERLRSALVGATG